MKHGSFDPFLGKIDRPNNIFGPEPPLGAGQPHPGADFSTKTQILSYRSWRPEIENFLYIS